MAEWTSFRTPPDSAREVIVVTEDDFFWIAAYHSQVEPNQRWQTSETGKVLTGVTFWRPLPRKP